MENKIKKLLDRFVEVENTLGQLDVSKDKKTYFKLSQEYSNLKELKELWEKYNKKIEELNKDKELLKNEEDEELISMLNSDIENLQQSIVSLKLKIESLLIPPDPKDNCNIIMELRAGTGGDEASIFVGDCVRMYRFYFDKKGWKTELLSCTPSESGGYKEYIIAVSGKNVFKYMKYESGTHRVQRVPVTETQGRVHTSAITVAILFEPEESEKIEIDEKELKIDTYRASGAGGQHVNTTDSAVRITHIPTGIVVCCQAERSQHKNKEKAMRFLIAKVAEEKERKEKKERASERFSQIGTGDRSEKIRTYNFPQNRVTDHRSKITLYKLDHVINGDLDEIIDSLIKYFYDKRMAS